MVETLTKSLQIPEGVSINLDNKVLKVKGEKGCIIRNFSQIPILIQIENGEVLVSTTTSRRKTIALVGTIISHINNMIKGVTNGFTYKMKIVYAHFPISVRIDEKRVIIENFIGERKSRIAKIVGNTEVIVKEDDLLIRGINLEKVSQTAANIEQATKVKEKDPRKFLDGIYIYEKKEEFLS
jgi:large subunit ribosomal protein L6